MSYDNNILYKLTGLFGLALSCNSV